MFLVNEGDKEFGITMDHLLGVNNSVVLLTAAHLFTNYSIGDLY